MKRPSPTSPKHHGDKDKRMKRTSQEVLKSKPLEPLYTCDERGYINFAEDLVIKNQYKMVAQIGKGTFSRVIKCQDLEAKKDDDKLVALKINRNVEKYQWAAKTEQEILTSIVAWDRQNRSGCIHLKASFKFCGHQIFVFPLLGKSLYDFASSNRFVPFGLPQIKQFMLQIVAAVKFMHDSKIIFTDLKPENIVFVGNRTIRRPIASMEPNLPYAFRYWKEREAEKKHRDRAKVNSTAEIPLDTRIKVIDFGSALFADRAHSNQHLVQTRHYRAPEVVLGQRWSYAIDIWSIGCIMLEFIYGRMVFNTHDSIDHLDQMSTMIGPIPPRMIRSPSNKEITSMFHNDGTLRLEDAKRSHVHCKNLNRYFGPNEAKMLDLVSKMLKWDPKDRINCNEALRHPYFADVDTREFKRTLIDFYKNLGVKIAFAKCKKTVRRNHDHGPSTHEKQAPPNPPNVSKPENSLSSNSNSSNSLSPLPEEKSTSQSVGLQEDGFRYDDKQQSSEKRGMSF